MAHVDPATARRKTATGRISSAQDGRSRAGYPPPTMRLQILSDLHLETETFDAQPAPGAELLILAGDIDRDWEGLRRFAAWPVPVLFVAGNHEFDGRDVDQAAIDLRAFWDSLGIRMLHRDSAVIADAQGRRPRFL